MKRDLDLCREILRQIEESPYSAGPSIEVKDRSAEEISYHTKLLAEAGFIEAGSAGGQFVSDDVTVVRGLKVYSPISLTWQGHEFLDAARNDTLWNEAKHEVGSRLGAIPFELVQAVLVDLGRKLVGLG